MKKTVVTGVDSSQTALNAARRAAELADTLGAELHVFSAYSTTSSVAVWSATVRKTEAQAAEAAQQAADAVADVLREERPNLTVISSAQEGTPAEVLLAQATELDAEIIVVGNKHVQGMARVLGSVAQKVASEARCDLHIVNTTNPA